LSSIEGRYGLSLGASLAIYGFSDSARLAVALAVHLAEAQPGRLKVEDLARLSGASTWSAGRALRALAEGRMVRSTRGPRGGWRLSLPANCIRLRDILEPFRCSESRNGGNGNGNGNGKSHSGHRNGAAAAGGNGDGSGKGNGGGSGNGNGSHMLDELVVMAHAAADARLADVTLAQLVEERSVPATSAGNAHVPTGPSASDAF
jgi:DNA-binding IscR family transcriptional regulator